MRADRALVIWGLLIGSALVLLIPPFQSPDEPLHFLRAWQISEGKLLADGTDARGMTYGNFPASLYDIWLRFSKVGFHPEVKISRRQIMQALDVPLDPQRRMRVTLGATAHYSPVCYLPQCLGIWIGRTFGARPLEDMYLAREANLLAWIAMAFLAMRTTPAMTRPLLLLVLMPMSLYQACTCSADAPTSAAAILFTATVLRAAHGPEDFWKLAVLSAAVCLCKFAYFPLLILLLLIPPGNLGEGRPPWMRMVILLCIGLGAGLAWALASSGTGSRISLSAGVSPLEQLHWLGEHLNRVVPIFLRTARASGWYVLKTYVGLIGWSDAYFPAWFVVAYLLAMALACAAAKDWLPRTRTLGIVFIAVFLSVLIIVLLSDLYWTPVGAGSVDGLSGRYLIPLSPAVFIMIRAMLGRSAPWPERWMNPSTWAICAGADVYLLALVWQRFYG